MLRTLRVSVIDRCSYRCPYCRPGTLTPFFERSTWLTVADYARLAPIFAGLGVSKLRLTGGEPLLRRDLTQVVTAFRRALPHAELALTTNGQLLGGQLSSLQRAGLRRATVHVDSLRPERYRALMGDHDVGDVLAAARVASRLLDEVKLNVVVQRDRNDDELCDFLSWSRESGIEVRFIELMNTGSSQGYVQSAFISGAEIVRKIGERLGADRLPRRHPSDTAALYRTHDGVTFGVIASDTEPFCGQCDRVRLTANGHLRGCLYESPGIDLAGALRGADDERLRALVTHAVAKKQSHHPTTRRSLPLFSMSETGG